MVEPKYNYKIVGQYPKKEQIAFLNLSYSRYFQLIERFKGALNDHQKFLTLKELISLFNEVDSYKPLKDTLKSAPTGSFLKKFGLLFKALRNLLLHFPFYDNWNDVVFNREIVLCMEPTNSSIDKYFKGPDHMQFFFRFGEPDGEKVEGRILEPVGYLEGKDIRLENIISLDDATSLLVGFMRLIMMSGLDSGSLQFLEKDVPSE